MFFRRKKSSKPPAPGVPASGKRGVSTAVLASRTVGVDAVELAAQHPDLFEQWQRGDLRPAAITLAFDPRAVGGRNVLFRSTEFVGPWVDEACGIPVPGVSRWEAGLFYPTWEQLCKLAALTQTPLETLLSSRDTPNFLNGCSQEPMGFALRQRFHPAIVATAVNSHPDQASLEDMTQALNRAIADIQQAIEEKIDPLTLLLK